MDHDFWWLMYDIDLMFHLLERHTLDIEQLIADSFPGPYSPDLSQPVELTPDDEWLNRRLSRRRRRPKRQLHPCCLQIWHKWDRRERSHHRAERLNLIHKMGKRDLAEQLDDYIANQTTSVPSFGMTIGNENFRKNIGEYPLTYTDSADVIHEADVDDEPDSEPAWQYCGFDSQADYEEYLLECRDIADRDWDESSYDDDAAQFETA